MCTPIRSFLPLRASERVVRGRAVTNGVWALILVRAAAVYGAAALQLQQPATEQRPGSKPLLDDSQKQRVVAMVRGKPPEGRAHWTVRLVAEEAVKRKLAPHAGRHFTTATPDRCAAQFAQLMRRLVGQ